MPSGPKSGKFMNRHAMEARERAEERNAKQKADQAKAREDAMWADDDPKASKRAGKQREAEAKARELMDRRAERREQLAVEESELNSKAPQKVVRRQIQKDLTKMATEKDRGRAGEPPKPQQQQQEEQRRGGAVAVDAESAPLPKGNPNSREKHAEVPAETTAATIEDRHMGKRARVLYKKFCEAQREALEEERPGLRKSQYSDVLWKMWQKSPENPFVQRSEMRSAEWLEQKRRWIEGDEELSDEEEGI